MTKRDPEGPGRRLGRVAAVVAALIFLQASNCSDNVGTSGTGAVTFRVSVGLEDLQAAGASDHPSVSADGRYVAFASLANNISTLPTGFKEVFVKDRMTGLVRNVSQLSNALNPSMVADCDNPSISPDGRWVVFETQTDYLGSFGATLQTTKNICVADLTTTALPQVLVGYGVGWPNRDCKNASVAQNGTSIWIVFESSALNIPSHANIAGSAQIYAIDISGGVNITEQVNIVSHSTANATTFCTGGAETPQISGDGSTVAFSSKAPDLLSPLTSGTVQLIYVGTPTAGTVQLVSTATGAPMPNANGDCLKPALSTNGNFVVFTSESTNLVAGGAIRDVLLRDIAGQTTTQVASNVQALVGSGLVNSMGFPIGVSDDGRWVTYVSRADGQVYLRDMQGGASLVSVNQSGVPGDMSSISSIITPDGRFVFWQSAADNLVIGDTNGALDIFGRGPLH